MNYKMIISYDGQNYFGWQRHGNKPTIQAALEESIGSLFSLSVVVRASGRTDRGAHANGQVITVELPQLEAVGEVKDTLNHVLPDDIRVLDIDPVSPDFHPRESAIGKRYRYLILDNKQLPADRAGKVWHVRPGLDLTRMKECSGLLLGTHDFASFATKTNFRQKSTIRTITLLEIHRDKDLIFIDICADGFLYKMVRNIVRAIVKVGEGRYSSEQFRHILKARDRTASPGTAPASGLYLEKVYYTEQQRQEDASMLVTQI